MGEVGMVKNRSITDIHMLILFVLFWMFNIVLISWAAQNGDLERLMLKSDDYGNICGRNITNNNTNFANKKYLLAMDYNNTKEALHICVEMCPNVTLKDRSDLLTFSKKYHVQLCNYRVPVDEYTDKDKHPSSNKGPCPILPFQKTTIYMRKCVPVFDRIKKNEGEKDDKAVVETSGMDQISAAAEDIKKCYGTIAAMSFLSLILYFAFMWILPYLNTCMVKVMMNLLNITFFVLAIICWTKFFQLPKGNLKQLNSTDTSQNVTVIFAGQEEGQTYVYAAALFTLLFIISVAITVFLWTRLQFINACFRQARSAVCKMPYLILLPFIFNVLIILVLMLFSWLFLSTTSVALLNVKTSRLSNTAIDVPFFGAKLPVYVLHAIYVFIMFWTIETLLAMNHFCISIPIAATFFDQEETKKRYKLFMGLLICLRYHLGSMIKAAALNQIMKLIRALAEQAEKKLKLMKIITWIVGCIGDIIHANTNCSLTVLAIEGTPYCTSMLKAHKLVLFNLLRLSFVMRACTLYTIIGQIIISVFTAFLTTKLTETNPDISSPLAPSALVFIVSFITGVCFFSVFQSAITTYAICFCTLQNAGTADPYHYFTAAEVSMYENMHKKNDKSQQESEKHSAKPK